MDDGEGGPKKKKARKEATGAAPLSETKKLLPMMEGEMRDYQLKGVRWLIALYQNGLNGKASASLD